MGTVLVVDDEPMVRDVVTRYLERDGHRVVEAADGEAARSLIERESPSLVLLDIMLPGRTDGLELCRWIRATSDLPVILLTARVEETDRIVGSSSAPTTTSRSRSRRASLPPASRPSSAARVRAHLRVSGSRSALCKWTPGHTRRRATASLSA
jgi:CheY-like chemotaxis protein